MLLHPTADDPLSTDAEPAPHQAHARARLAVVARAAAQPRPLSSPPTA